MSPFLQMLHSPQSHQFQIPSHFTFLTNTHKLLMALFIHNNNQTHRTPTTHHIQHLEQLTPITKMIRQHYPNLQHRTHNTTHTKTQRDNYTQFSLSIARPKIDFLPFSGDDPINRLHQCEKYFTLASIPMETGVPLATLHCHGPALSWCRSLHTSANYLHWTHLCNMV
jgi:hypothetical protein